MNYLEFYEMTMEPFSNAPVGRFYYNSGPHSKALVRLMYAIDNMKGLAVLLGEIGSGKTTLARRLLDSLSEEEYEAALLVIIHSGVDAKWLLKRIAMQLGVEEPADERLKLLGQLYQRLVEIHESGRKAVVLIDEAQMLDSREIMEEFRGLLNLELPESKLLNIIFFGMPELESHLALDPPLAQRVAVKYRLDALDPEATEAYIKHRLRLAGAKRMLFTKEATEAVYAFSKGIPRLINTICDNALFEGHMIRAPLIEAPMIEAVCQELGMNTDFEGAAEAGVGVSDFDTPIERAPQGFPRGTPPAVPVTPPMTTPKGKRAPVVAPPQHHENADLDEIASIGAKPETPLMDEIDGILDNLIDKV